MKSEKGSITAFVVCMCLLIIVVCIQIYINNKNALNNANEKQEIIEKQYNSENVDALYENAIQNIEANGGNNQ